MASGKRAAAKGARPAAKAGARKAARAKAPAVAKAKKRPSRWAEEMAAQLEASRTATGPLAKAFAALKQSCAALPGAWEDHPWGHTVYKTGKKMFVILGCSTAELTCTAKLPHSGEAALTLFRFASPTGYGMGKSGWVTATFARGDAVPLPVLRDWIAESHAAISPKRRAKGTRS